MVIHNRLLGLALCNRLTWYGLIQEMYLPWPYKIYIFGVALYNRYIWFGLKQRVWYPSWTPNENRCLLFVFHARHSLVIGLFYSAVMNNSLPSIMAGLIIYSAVVYSQQFKHEHSLKHYIWLCAIYVWPNAAWSPFIIEHAIFSFLYLSAVWFKER